MKAQCDACSLKEATVFCYTEELALCHRCDHHTHRLPQEHHHRFSIFYPLPKRIPICDTCQETKAFFFCLEHRAILCRICDVTLHSKDALSAKHSRFVLNSIKFCTDDKNNDGDQPEPLENESVNLQDCSAEITTTPPPGPAEKKKGKSVVDMSCDDDPYGLCEMGEGSGSIFADTDLGCYLKSLSPKTH